jgi:citrate synthase
VDEHLLSTADAAARLGVKRETLYAYVSRGLLQAHKPEGRRGSWFDPVELDALVGRARGPADRRPELRIASSITLIEQGHYWYRGHDPAVLAVTRCYEAVAELLWTGHDHAAPPVWPVDAAGTDRARAAQESLPGDASPTDRLRLIVAVLGASDPLRYDLRPEGAVATARRLLAGTVAALPGRTRGTVAEQVTSWVGPRRPAIGTVQAVETALVLLADHELAASTLAVRVASSFKADPYASVSAGLGAVAGARHGAASRAVEDLLADIAGGRAADEAVGRLLRGGDLVPGFGHGLYPDGDPRAVVLLDLARQHAATPEADAVLAVAAGQGVPPPNVDFGLAVLARALRLRPGAGEAIFGVGRLAGWLGHAIEEYADRSDLRLRTLYTGPRPAAR